MPSFYVIIRNDKVAAAYISCQTVLTAELVSSTVCVEKGRTWVKPAAMMVAAPASTFPLPSFFFLAFVQCVTE